MSALQVKGFGGLELAANGLAIQSFPTRHVEELLGYLLLNQNQTYDRDNLVELLWPHDYSGNGRGRLSTVLWRLRSLFDKLGINKNSIIQTSRDHVMFAPGESLLFDVESFEHQLDVARAATEDAARLDALAKAINQYQGDLFTGIYSDWCLIERERLAQKHLRALGELMHCHIQQNDYATAIGVGQSILNSDPLREEVHRDLIYCYGQLGHRAKASAQFQLCVDYLMLELKVHPMPETVRIYQEIVTGSISDSLPAPNRDLLERANRAKLEFQQAGNNLIRILSEIENLSSVTVSDRSLTY